MLQFLLFTFFSIFTPKSLFFFFQSPPFSPRQKSLPRVSLFIVLSIFCPPLTQSFAPSPLYDLPLFHHHFSAIPFPSGSQFPVFSLHSAFILLSGIQYRDERYTPSRLTALLPFFPLTRSSLCLLFPTIPISFRRDGWDRRYIACFSIRPAPFPRRLSFPPFLL